MAPNPTPPPSPNPRLRTSAPPSSSWRRSSPRRAVRTRPSPRRRNGEALVEREVLELGRRSHGRHLPVPGRDAVGQVDGLEARARGHHRLQSAPPRPLSPSRGTPVERRQADRPRRTARRRGRRRRAPRTRRDRATRGAGRGGARAGAPPAGAATRSGAMRPWRARMHGKRGGTTCGRGGDCGGGSEAEAPLQGARRRRTRCRPRSW
jgi:translation initiation factor IF-2